MNTQPEALRLADALEQDNRGYEPVTQAAAELRRLHKVNEKLLEALKGLHDDTMDYIRLNSLGAENNHWLVQARAAIAKATGETNE